MNLSCRNYLFRHFHHRLIRHTRLGIVVVLLGAWGLLATGVPVAIISRPAKSSGGELYPCIGCPCGCVSAEICWDRCCCMSDREKLAWASENNITPPSFLVERVAAQTHNVAKRACCCQCGDKDVAKCSPPKSDGDASQTKVVVTGWAAAKCRGIDLLWQTLTTGLVDTPVTTDIDPPLVARWAPSFQGWPKFFQSPDPPVPLATATQS